MKRTPYPIQEFMDTKRAWYETIVYPKANDQLRVEVKRDGKVLPLEARPKRKKLKRARIKVNDDRSEAQKTFSNVFFYKEVEQKADPK